MEKLKSSFLIYLCNYKYNLCYILEYYCCISTILMNVVQTFFKHLQAPFSTAEPPSQTVSDAGRLFAV